VSALRREDVVAHLQRWERPDAAILGVAGARPRAPRPRLLATPPPPQRAAYLPARPGGRDAALRTGRLTACPFYQCGRMAATPGTMRVCAVAAGEALAAGGRVQTPRQAGRSPASACILARLKLSAQAVEAERARAGDFDAADMRATVERALGGWRPAPGQPAAPPPVPGSPLPPPPPPGRVFLVDRPGLTQARLRLSGARAGPETAGCNCYVLLRCGEGVEGACLHLRCVRSGGERSAPVLHLTVA
jgi:hypothetical protein